MTHAIALATLPLPTVSARLSVTEPGESYRLTTLPAPIVQAALSVAASRVLSGHPMMIFQIPQVANLTYPASLSYQGVRMKNYPVDRTDFRLVRGVTNEIIFFVRDIDRKPVTLTMGETLTMNIVDTKTGTLLMTRALTVFDSSKGIYQFATLPSEMDAWPTGPLRWSISCTRADASTIMLWTDLSYSPYSYLYVTETPTPEGTTTAVIAWDDFSLLTDSKYYSESLVGAAQDGYVGGVQTFVASMTTFTGTIRIDASLAAQPDPDAGSPDWFTATSVDYDANTGTDNIDVVGNYVWLRIAVTLTDGTLTQVSYKV